VEAVAGLALILGLRLRRGAAAIVGGLLVVFILAIGINLLRDNPIDCGCFEGSGPPKTREEKFLDMWIVLLRDVAMLAGIAQIFCVERATALRAALAGKDPKAGA
jgi:putative oxidoreductase